MAIVPGAFLSLGLSVTKALQSFAIVIRNRRQARELTHWDSRALKDIGLTQSDLVGALSLPLHQDPTELLAHMAGRSPRANRESRVREGLKDGAKPGLILPGSLPSSRTALSA